MPSAAEAISSQGTHAMKAVVYDQAGPAAEVFSYIDVPDPDIGPDDVLISIEAIAIEGGDLINRRSVAPPHRNYVVGYAAAGRVVAVGANVKGRSIGDRVTSFDMNGSHATMRAVPAARTWLIPDAVDMASAAALPIAFGTAHHCLFAKAALRPRETVVILAAAGGVGIAAVQLAHQAGAQVIAVASGAGRSAQLRALGATHVIDRHEQDVVAEVLRITDGEGADVVIDPVGTTLQASLAALAPEGRLVFVGNAGGGGLTVDLWPAMQANQTLYGVFMGTQLERPAIRATIDDMVQAVAERRLDVVIERRFPLAEAAAAHVFAETGKPLGGVIMTP